MPARLFEPVTLRDVTLRNRVVMGSMHTGLEDHAKDIPKLAAYFAERAKGGVALSITGGFAPSWRGWLLPFGSEMSRKRHADKHRLVTDSVHEHGGKIALQVLHAGRYGYSPFKKGVSSVRARNSTLPTRWPRPGSTTTTGRLIAHPPSPQGGG